MAVMSEETQVVRPLESSEVKDIIAQIIAEKVRDSLNSTCWLYGMSWPKFKATWRVDITLENFGEERETFVEGSTGPQAFIEDRGDFVQTQEDVAGKVVNVKGEIPFTPPNVLRKAHGLAIPTVVKRDDGSTEQKAVVFRQTRAKKYSASDTVGG